MEPVINKAGISMQGRAIGQNVIESSLYEIIEFYP